MRERHFHFFTVSVCDVWCVVLRTHNMHYKVYLFNSTASIAMRTPSLFCGKCYVIEHMVFVPIMKFGLLY